MGSIYDTTHVIDSLISDITYFWRVFAKNINNDSLWSNETFKFHVKYEGTGLKRKLQKRSKRFLLYQNYPNPFNPSTKIEFSLLKAETVTIKVYNIIGQKIVTLLNKPMPAGYHEFQFDAQNLSSGIYLYRIEAGMWTDTKKMLLVK